MKNEFEYKLVVVQEGKEVFSAPLGCEELHRIATDYPDNMDGNELFKYLAHHPSSDVRAAVACKDSLGNEVISILKADKSLNVLEKLLWSTAFAKVVSSEDIENLIKLESNEITGAIIARLSYYTEIDAMEISLKLLQSPDPRVRYQLASDSDTHKKILSSLLKDKDFSVVAAAKHNSQRRF